MKVANKNVWMRVVNYALYLSGCFLAGTGWLLAERLPRGREGRGLDLFGLGRHDWGEWHEWVAYVSIALVILHLLLNWQWIVVIASQRRQWRIAAGLLPGVALVLLFVIAPIHGR